MPTSNPYAITHLRGCVVGVATGALAIAAHGAAGGGYPSSAGGALLLLTALITGLVSGSVVAGFRIRWSAHRATTPGLGVFLPLALGQFAGHWALTGLTGHHAGANAGISTGAGPDIGFVPSIVTAGLDHNGPSSAAMLAAHLLAVLLCTSAITAAERLYREVSATLRVLLVPPRLSPRAPRVLAAVVVAALSHRAPNGASGPRAPPVRAAARLPRSLARESVQLCPTGFPEPCGAA